MEEIRDKNGLTEAEFLAAYDSGKYPKPSATADVCIIAKSGKGAEILLIKRGGHPFLGCWALPGGFANKNEPLEETAARELLEETGITGVHLSLVGVYSRPGRDPRGWTISAAYAAKVNEADIKVAAGDDAAAACWFKAETGKDGLTLVNNEISLTVTPGAPAGTGGLAFDHADIISDAAAKFLQES